MNEDTRKFDGPFDKREMCYERNIMLNNVLKGDLYIRVPNHMDGEGVEDMRKANRGHMKKVDSLSTDQGYRWTHEVVVTTERPNKTVTPISFDAGSCALWASPLGWRVLECWHHDDPTYGINIVIYDPWGDVHAKAEQMGPEMVSWLEANLP